MKKRHGRKHYKGRNYHHLRNKCRGGSNHVSNLLLIDIKRHRAWHELFRNLDLGQVIDLLIRLERAKGGQK